MEGDSLNHRGVSLRGILPEGEIVGAHDMFVTRVSADSRGCRTGDLYVALVGRDADGHRSISEAVRLGASGVVASQPVSRCPVPVCYVADTSEAYGRVCQALAGTPSGKLKVIGVAGAFGKTTTAYLAASSLAACGCQPGILSSLGYCDGAEIADARWTTPPADIAAAWMARMVEQRRTHAVVEISGRGLLDNRLAGVAFDSLCVTNLRGDRDSCNAIGYRRWTSRLLDCLPSECVLVVNVDDPISRDLADRHDGPVLTVGIDQPAEFSATIIERHRSEQTFLLSFGREIVPVRTTLLGRHNVINCLVATALASSYGLDPHSIVRGIEEVHELPGRLERIECGQPFGVFVDEGASPEAVAICLESLREATSGRLTCVFNAASGLGGVQRVRLASAVDRLCDSAIVTQARETDDSGRSRELVAAFREAKKCSFVSSRAEAVRRALREARDGDCVLIAGRGRMSYGEAGGEFGQCDDRQLARQALHQLQNQCARAA
ncbi:MAG: hypothetical protein JNL96_13080 [Planctomycetaceae bacterium]|nr:hypothetical protein [Planctomycetaceae bacterium]